MLYSYLLRGLGSCCRRPVLSKSQMTLRFWMGIEAPPGLHSSSCSRVAHFHIIPPHWMPELARNQTELTRLNSDFPTKDTKSVPFNGMHTYPLLPKASHSIPLHIGSFWMGPLWAPRVSLLYFYQQHYKLSPLICNVNPTLIFTHPFFCYPNTPLSWTEDSLE